MATNDYPKVQAATSMLGRMLAGLSITTGERHDEETPDVALDAIEADPDNYAVSTTAILPTGDRYRITVAWVQEDSP